MTATQVCRKSSLARGGVSCLHPTTPITRVRKDRDRDRDFGCSGSPQCPLDLAAMIETSYPYQVQHNCGAEGARQGYCTAEWRLICPVSASPAQRSWCYRG